MIPWICSWCYGVCQCMRDGIPQVVRIVSLADRNDILLLPCTLSRACFFFLPSRCIFLFCWLQPVCLVATCRISGKRAINSVIASPLPQGRHRSICTGYIFRKEPVRGWRACLPRIHHVSSFHTPAPERQIAGGEKFRPRKFDAVAPHA